MRQFGCAAGEYLQVAAGKRVSAGYVMEGHGHSKCHTFMRWNLMIGRLVCRVHKARTDQCFSPCTAINAHKKRTHRQQTFTGKLPGIKIEPATARQRASSPSVKWQSKIARHLKCGFFILSLWKKIEYLN